MSDGKKGLKGQSTHELEKLRVRLADLAGIEQECQIAREALQESQTELSAIFDNAPITMILVDEEGYVHKANRTAVAFTGQPQEEMLGLRGGEAFRCIHALHHPQGCGFSEACETCLIRRAVLDTLATGEARRREEASLTVVEGSQKNDLRLLVSTTPINVSSTSMVLVSVEDITEQKRAEEALRQRTIELEERNAELDAFAHTAAHDLKNPLGLVVGYAEMMTEMEESEIAQTAGECLKHIHAIARNARRMNNIIDELLLLAEARKLEVGMGPLEMAPIVTEAKGRLTDLIAQQQTTITEPESWPTALGYAPWVEEVWANYLSNAVKYSGEPSRVEIGATEQDDGYVRFWVKDNGGGLSEEAQTQLFTPFTRLDHVRARGHGLGLSIVRRIMVKLGGKVGVESQLGAGSTFWFTLPAVHADPVQDAP